MAFWQRRDAESIQEVIAVEIKEGGGQSIGWVAPDVAAALVNGEMTPDQVAEIARANPDMPAGTERIAAGYVWQDN